MSRHGCAEISAEAARCAKLRQPRLARLVLAALLAALASGGATARAADTPSDPRPAERGLPSITPVSTAQVGSSQIFGVSVAGRRLYVATLAGLSIFDGAHWELLPSPRAIYAVHAAGHGRVVAGGPDQLVELRVHADGRRSLEPLLGTLADADRAIGDVRSVHALDDTFFVVTDRMLLQLSGASLRVVERWRSDPSRRGFVSRGRLYVVSQSAVRAYARSGAPLTDALTGYDVAKGGVAFVVDHPLGVQLVGIDGRGIVAVRDGAWRPLGDGADDLLRRGLTDARVLADGTVAIATVSSGVLRLASDLSFDGTLGRPEGLPSSHIVSLADDQEGGLWAAGNADLSRIDLGAPLTRIDARLGLEGTVNGVVRYRDRLHVLTTSGLYAVDHAPGTRLRATRLPGVTARTWSALDAGEHLLVATAEGVFESRSAGARLVPGTARLSAYALAAVPDDPRHVLVGTRTGLSVLVRDGAGWRFDRHVPGAPRYVRHIVARPGGVVYIGSTFDGAMRLSLTDPTGAPHTLSVGETMLRDVDGVIHVLATEASTLSTIDETRAVVVPRTPAAPVPAHTVRFAFDASGALWMTGTGAVVVAPGARVPRPLLDASVSVQAVGVEADGVVWLGGASGLWRVAGGLGPRQTPPPPPTLEHAFVNGQPVSMVRHGGAPLALPPGIERLRLEFSPNTFSATAVTDFKLEPLDAEWIPTRQGHAAEYTSLPEGAYRLRVRSTIGADQAESTWAFTVRPPWYRTPLVYVLEVLACLGLVMLAGRLRTRQLQRRAEELERAVVQKTAALQDANRRLAELAWRDDLTGLHNRRHFEDALAEEWARAHRTRAPIALVLVDIDHFKALNDTLGHAAGDRAIKAVADVIRTCARRPGDVAARYGGDEFAVLLPGGRWERVHALAEEIREAVEAMALPHPRHPLDYITVSVGVAAVTAPEDLEPTLVDAADRALYRAKAAGRNAVAA